MATTAPLLVEKVKLAKAPLEMHYLGDRVLRQPAKRISRVDDNVRELIVKMLQTMYTQDGIGLAAPQVGFNKQLIIIDVALDEPTVPPVVLINPKILGSSREIALGQEGCLSIPNVFLDVKRPAAIEVSYKDENGRPQKRRFDGLPARVIQHEMDHLNGVMFVDRVESDIELTQALSKEGFAAKDVRPVKKGKKK
ncbi:MAG: peptide deformylase [Geitlerinemataceae cyanobacterium]